MKAITLHNFWAAAMAPLLVKTIETRSWPTHYRGPLAIHAAATVPAKARRIYSESDVVREQLRRLGVHSAKELETLPTGVVGVCDLVACVPVGQGLLEGIEGVEQFRAPAAESVEHAFGDYSINRFMWFTVNMRVLKTPVPAKGMQRLWDLPAAVERQVSEQLLLIAA